MDFHKISLGFAVAVLAGSVPAEAAIYGPCRFNSETLRFGGTVAETTACLLRKVRERGSGADAQPVPEWLLERVTRPFPFSAGQVQRYIDAENIVASDLTDRIAVGDTPDRRYFVIHDTSAPEIESAGTAFPANINEASYSGNRLNGWTGAARRVNLIISRDGRSRRLREWGASRPLPATKIEQTNRAPAARRVFVHVENIQPRIKPPGSWAWRAPVPGFAPAQEERLALAYVIASMRAGRWLIPAYHFNIDQGLPDVHDDPQHADLASWVAKVQEIEAGIAAIGSP